MSSTDLIVAYQGEPGAYSEQGCRQFFGEDVQTFPCRTFEDMFIAVHDGRAKQIMLPVENSLAGTVISAYDLLVDYNLRVQGEEIVAVKHCLIAPHGVTLQEIKYVKSHPQALMQCAKTLKRMGVEPVVGNDTAGSARELSETNEPGMAAIASELAAQTYNMNILARDLQDLPNNYTRMFVLGKEDAPRCDPSKTSIIFTTRHEPGDLYRVLGEFAERGINLTKLESRPRRNVAWSYRFFVDFHGHEDDLIVQQALLGVLKRATNLNVLGSYPVKANG